jgi:uncharacterized delta-60 repeat protein
MSRFQCTALFARKSKPRSNLRKARLVVEALEERALLSVAGTLDPTFGNGGLQATAFMTQAAGNAVAIDRSGGPTNGDIYVAGSASDPGNPSEDDFVLARYLPNGQVDTSFGTGGEVLTNFRNTPISAGNATAQAVAVQKDGGIVVAGSASVKNYANPNRGGIDFAVARYNPDGSPDTHFGTNGLVAFDFTILFSSNLPQSDFINALGIDSRNRIVVGGDAFDPSNGVADYALARLEPSGELDSNFGPAGNGRVIDNINSAQGLAPGDDILNGLAIDASDNIVVAASALDGNTMLRHWVVARFLSSGRPDGGFGSLGATVTSFSAGTSASGHAVALGPGGRIVVAGKVGFGTNELFGLAEYQSNGVLDPAFGNAGKTTTAINNQDSVQGVGFDPAGNVVVAGDTHDPTLGADVFALARYTPGGTLDPSFDPISRLPGVVTTSFFQKSDIAFGLAIQPDGDIVAAGVVIRPNGEPSIGLARYEGTHPTPTPPAHRSIVAELVPVKVHKKRKLMVEVLDAATGAVEAEFLCPFHAPLFSAVQASAVQGSGAGQPDEILLTARRGHHTVRATFFV